MDSLPEWAPAGVDLTRASAARMYDYYLGGLHNFAVDRELGEQALQAFPDGRMIAQANRAFLHRVVRYLLDQGVRQFLDVGSGIPTSGNVHEIAQAQAADAKVLYVDNDAVAVAHSDLILAGNENARVLEADFRDPASIVSSAQFKELFDLDRPVGVLLIALLHFVSVEDRPEDAIARLREVVPAGSYLAIAQGTGEGRHAANEKVAQIYRSTATPVTARTREQIRALFDGWELVEPGVVWLPEWRPDWPDDVGEDPAQVLLAGGVGRKP